MTFRDRVQPYSRHWETVLEAYRSALCSQNISIGNVITEEDLLMFEDWYPYEGRKPVYFTN